MCRFSDIKNLPGEEYKHLIWNLILKNYEFQMKQLLCVHKQCKYPVFLYLLPTMSKLLGIFWVYSEMFSYFKTELVKFHCEYLSQFVEKYYEFKWMMQLGAYKNRLQCNYNRQMKLHFFSTSDECSLQISSHVRKFLIIIL